MQAAPASPGVGGVAHYVDHPDEDAMPPVSPFGEVIGMAHGVPAFSSDYDSAHPGLARHDYMGSHEGIYTGYKYQCVEYARRYLVASRGITFPDVRMAYEIFQLPAFVRLADGEPLPVVATRNGHPGPRPQPGTVIMWKSGGFFQHTGHVAIVVEATDTYIRVAEQNVTDAVWPGEYSRELPVEVYPNGTYLIRERFRRTHVLGWLTLAHELLGGETQTATVAAPVQSAAPQSSI